jgi:acid stress-induced BolA-like protein IbaG/YrbA
MILNDNITCEHVKVQGQNKDRQIVEIRLDY